jgi:hypothetical protein
VGSKLAATVADVIVATTKSAALVLEPTFDKARAAAGPATADAFARVWIQQVSCCRRRPPVALAVPSADDAAAPDPRRPSAMAPWAPCSSGSPPSRSC